MAQQDYTGIGEGKIETCMCCGEDKDAHKDMFFSALYLGFCYDCFDAIPGCIREKQYVRFLTRMGERRVNNEQTL